MTTRLRDLPLIGAGLLCALMFPSAHWWPLRVTLALGTGAALLLALALALAVRRWWRPDVALTGNVPRPLPRRDLWTDADRDALAEIGVRLPGESDTPERRAP